MKKLFSSLFFTVFFFLLTGMFLFARLPQNAYACTSNADCSCNEQCSVFFCVSSAGGPGSTCDRGAGTSCTPAWYYDSNHDFQQINNTCAQSFPGNVCDSTLHQPNNVFCSTGCSGLCNGTGPNTCGAGKYCSQDYGCTCKQSCDFLPTDSYCPLLGHNCASNYYINPAGHCGDGNSWDVCCTVKPTCNTDKVCGGWAPGQNFNDCGVVAQTRTCHYTTYNNSTNPPCQSSNFDEHQNPFLNSCNINAGYNCIGNNTCEATITVHVYIDYGHDGSHDANYPFGVVKINGGNQQTTGADGTVTYQEPVGTYTITYADNSPDYQQVGATQQTITLDNNNGNQTVNFRVTPLYRISGNIFQDKNKNQSYDPNCGNVNAANCDSAYTQTSTIHVVGPTAVADMTQTDGTYDTGEVLQSGTYTISQTHALADGFSYTTPSTWSVTVGDRGTAGPQCNKSTSLDATCGNPNDGSITNLNIGMTDENPWNQEACYDVRDDSGSYIDQIPAAPSCGGVSGAYNTITNGSCSTGSGIVFTCNATGDFGFGSANVDNWIAGGTTAQTQECYTNAGLDVVRTSYEYLETTARQSNITPVDMNGVGVCGAGGIADCTLSNSLTKGIYQANGTVNLNAYTFPHPANPTTTAWSYIFLINGDLHINGNILIPKGSVAVFSVSGNIYVDKAVGQTVTNTTDPAVNNPNIEGLYSADGSFIVQSYGSAGNYCNTDGTPKDKKLNILGSVVTNAGKAGGTLTNNRDLCIFDYACSSASGGDGTGASSDGNGGTGGIDGSGATGPGTFMNYLLTLLADGQFLTHKNFNWQELRP